MKTEVHHIGAMHLIRLIGDSGAWVELCDLGARITKCVVRDAKGQLGNVVMDYDSTDQYKADPEYRGAVIGRFANRIGHSVMTIGGKEYKLQPNDGAHCNHGGPSGINNKLWGFELTEKGVAFGIKSPHGEGGFPGNVEIRAAYSLDADDTLTLTLEGRADRETVLNLTNHAYINLSGKGALVLDHLLQTDATQYVETDAEYIPTGRLLPTEGSAADFRIAKSIGADLPKPYGYNHCLVTRKAMLSDPTSGRTLQVTTSMPGIMLYTAGYCDIPFESLSLEPQYWPDSPNHPGFPSCLISPWHPYHETISYKFGVTNKYQS